jgi:membrane-bound lytic murein transglycosylase B
MECADAFEEGTCRMNRPARTTLAILLFLAFASTPCPVFADWSPLIDRLVADGFDESAVRSLFLRPEVNFEGGVMSSKLEELLKRPLFKGAKRPPSYNPKLIYKDLLRGNVITKAHSYLKENGEILEKIKTQYCVPKEIVVSIVLIETRLGEFLGRKGAFNNLASMALSIDLETIGPHLPKRLVTPENEAAARSICRQKADWAYGELKSLLQYANWSGVDPLGLPGSLYGAIGICQFMPSNIFSYGIDADGDGRVDLFTTTDALFSVANYLRGHGWKCLMDRASQLWVILDYNRSTIYANTVLAVADKLREATPPRQRPYRAVSKRIPRS